MPLDPVGRFAVWVDATARPSERAVVFAVLGFAAVYGHGLLLGPLVQAVEPQRSLGSQELPRGLIAFNRLAQFVFGPSLEQLVTHKHPLAAVRRTEPPQLGETCSRRRHPSPHTEKASLQRIDLLHHEATHGVGFVPKRQGFHDGLPPFFGILQVTGILDVLVRREFIEMYVEKPLVAVHSLAHV